MRKRYRTRAAALVEAAVVIPLMVSLLAVLGLMKNGYDRKIQMNQQSRSQALDYASHNCQSQRITYSNTLQSQGRGLTAFRPDFSNPIVAGAQATIGGPFTSGLMIKAEVAYQGSTVRSFRDGIKGRPGLGLRVNGEKSIALCNEEPQDGNTFGTLNYAKDKLGSLMGL